eukprot:4070369-Pyramimonas_sp.AAC.1
MEKNKKNDSGGATGDAPAAPIGVPMLTWSSDVAPPEQRDEEAAVSNHAKVNEEHRREGDKWAGSRPAGHIIAIRLVMQPLRDLLQAKFEVAGEAWEIRQQADVAAALRNGLVLDRCRKYRAQVLADDECETRAFKQLSDLFDFDVWWNIIPQVDMTSKFRCVAFRMLSRVGCMIEFYLCDRHRKWPCRLFSCVNRERRQPWVELRAEAASQCIMMLDIVTLHLLASYDSWDGDELISIIRVVAHLARVDISVVEARHATLRRFLVGRSLQTNAMSLLDLGSEWVMHQARGANLCTEKKFMPEKRVRTSRRINPKVRIKKIDALGVRQRQTKKKKKLGNW